MGGAMRGIQSSKMSTALSLRCALIILHLIMELPGTECQATYFKNSSYIFSKSGRYWYSNENVCYLQGGYLVSIETEEEWQFINQEIQKRGTWNTSAWHIGLGKVGGVWTWESGEQLNISKWRDSQLDDRDDRAEISKNRGLFNSISWGDKNAFICEIPGECSNITFKNSWYIISVNGQSWLFNRETCQNQGGDLVSIETEEEWKFINDEIQRRNTKYYISTWSIGLTKKAGNWTWVSERPLTIYKWGKREPSGEHEKAIMYKRSSNGKPGVFGSTAWGNWHAYICEISKASSLASASASPSLSLLSSPSSSLLSSALGSASPSPSPSPSLTAPSSLLFRTVEHLANYYVSKLSGMNVTRKISIQEAVGVFEDFTINLKKVAKGKVSMEEVKTLRKSIFEAAEAVEKFAINYGKQHLSGMRPSERIVFPNMGEVAAFNPV